MRQETPNLHKMRREVAEENTPKATAVPPLHQYSINMQKRTNKLDCITINRVLRVLCVPLSMYLRVSAVCTYLNAAKTNCSEAKLTSTTLTVNVDAHAQPNSSHAIMPWWAHSKYLPFDWMQHKRQPTSLYRSRTLKLFFKGKKMKKIK